MPKSDEYPFVCRYYFEFFFHYHIFIFIFVFVCLLLYYAAFINCEEYYKLQRLFEQVLAVVSLPQVGARMKVLGMILTLLVVECAGGNYESI